MEKRRNTRRRSSEKVLMILLVAVVLIGCAVGGTIAYFTDKTETVTNTFTVGDIGELTLSEEGATGDTDKTQEFIIVPGIDLVKDPIVTYTPNTNEEYRNLDAYVFVEITTSDWAYSNKAYTINNGTDTLVSWTVADELTHLNTTTTDGVTKTIFYKVVNAADDQGNVVTTATDIHVMKPIANTSVENATIDVSTEITIENIADIAAKADAIVFKAYAIQKDGFADATAAWAALNS